MVHVCRYQNHTLHFIIVKPTFESPPQDGAGYVTFGLSSLEARMVAH